MFEKAKEIFDKGELVAELFKDDFFLALVSKERVSLRNSHYLMGHVRKDANGNYVRDMADYISLRRPEFDTFIDAAAEWESKRHSLWGKRAHGHSWCGYLGSTYFPPHSEDGTYIKKGESSAHLGVGKLEEQVKRGDFEFTFERFCLTIARDNQNAKFDVYQIPMVEEIFALYDKRKELYSSPSRDLVTLDDFSHWDI